MTIKAALLTEVAMICTTLRVSRGAGNNRGRFYKPK
jgi:hypothetical protein